MRKGAKAFPGLEVFSGPLSKGQDQTMFKLAEIPLTLSDPRRKGWAQWSPYGF